MICWKDLPRSLETVGTGASENRLGRAIASMVDGGSGLLYKSVIEETERHLLALVLQRTDGNIRRSARILGIARNTLKARIRRFDLLPSAGGCQEDESGAFGPSLGVS